MPYAYEANAVSLYLNKEWERALKETELWILDQPFSSRPALFASFISATCLDDYQKSESILKNTIISNPNDNILINNLAFALINQDKITEAEKVLNQFNHPNGTNEQIVWYATHGLLSFRKGLIEQGRELYTKAISVASRNGFEDHKALAALILAREEIKSSTSEANQAFSFAENLVKRSNDVVVSYLYDKIKELLDRSNIKKGDV